jgi:hypothetical protein
MSRKSRPLPVREVRIVSGLELSLELGMIDQVEAVRACYAARTGRALSAWGEDRTPRLSHP